MCTNPPDFGRQAAFYQKEPFLRRIKSLALEKPQLDQLLLTGGEPTVHPDFLAILSEIRNLLPRAQIKILTNGRAFFYELFAQKVLQTDNLSLTFSFCGHNARRHDAVTRSPGSFAQALVGLKNVLRHKNQTHHTEIRVVLTKLLLKENKKVSAFLAKNFSAVDALVFLFPEIEGICEQNTKTIVPTYTQTQKSDFFQNFAKLTTKFRDRRLYHFPLCVVPPKLWPNVWRTMDRDDTIFIPKCAHCRYQKSCLGIPVGYKRFFGDKEFKPILRKQGVRETKNLFRPIER